MKREKNRLLGFSLLEVILATAILASSAMVLSSLIGLGSKFGNRAEERTLAMNQLESLLDDFLARPATESGQSETSGELPGFPPRSFRISVAPYLLSAEAGLGRELQSAPTMPSKSELIRVTVELFATGDSTLHQNGDAQFRLSRIVRKPRTPLVESSTERNDGFAPGQRQ